MELARALCGTGAAPGGFDPNRLALAAKALRTKRLHAAARAWPSLSRRLGKEFGPQFAIYASGTPVPPTPRQDIMNFARFLGERRKLPADFLRGAHEGKLRARLFLIWGRARAMLARASGSH